MFEERTKEPAEQAADDFVRLIAEAPPRVRPKQPENYAEEFWAGLSAPAGPPPPFADPPARTPVAEPEPGLGATAPAAECQPGWGAAASACGSEPGWGATVGDRAVPPSPEVVALQEAIAAVAAIDPSTLDGAQALADATAVLAATGSLKLAAVARVADVEDRKRHRLDGSPTTPSWLRQHDTGLTAADVTVARRLPKLPTLAAAVADGSLGIGCAGKVAAQLVKLRRWLDRPDGLIDGQPAVQTLHAVIVDGVRGQVCQALGGLDDHDPRLIALMQQLAEIEARPVSEIDRIEAAFVLLAQHLEPAQLPGALGMLVDALLPNELERRAADAHDNRGFGIQPDFDGSGWHVTDGDWDLELGELAHTVLTAMMAVDGDNPADTDAYRNARDDGWTDADGQDALTGPGNAPGSAQRGPRSRRQRQHDALKAALRLLLDSGLLGSRDKVAPHFSVMVQAETMHGDPGAVPAVGGSGTRLPLSLVRSWWCDSSAGRFVMSLGRKVIETSHTERTLKAHERRAKHLETGGRCQCAGCTSGPGQRLIPHHPDPWHRSGRTSKNDTVLLCERDHTLLHQGHTIRLKDGRLLNANGWVT